MTYCAPQRPFLFPSWVSEKWPLRDKSLQQLLWIMKASPISKWTPSKWTQLQYICHFTQGKSRSSTAYKTPWYLASQYLSTPLYQCAYFTLCVSQIEPLLFAHMYPVSFPPLGNSTQTPNHFWSLSSDATCHEVFRFHCQEITSLPSEHFLAYYFVLLEVLSSLLYTRAVTLNWGNLVPQGIFGNV